MSDVNGLALSKSSKNYETCAKCMFVVVLETIGFSSAFMDRTKQIVGIQLIIESSI